MAPKPIEDVDFPALSDQILELLHTIWDFIRNICIVVWSYVSGAFLAVWTYPPFEKYRNELVAVLIALWEYVAAHPITVIAIAFVVFVVLPAVYRVLKIYLVLYLLRAQMQSVLHGSDVPNYQSVSVRFDGNAPRDSALARLQSVRMGKGGDEHHAAAGSSSFPSWH